MAKNKNLDGFVGKLGANCADNAPISKDPLRFFVEIADNFFENTQLKANPQEKYQRIYDISILNRRVKLITSTQVHMTRYSTIALFFLAVVALYD